MNWLTQRRKDLQLSQGELATRLQTEGLNITHATISHWETKRYNMPLSDQFFRTGLASSLRLSESDLLERSEFDTAEHGHSDEGEQAANLIDALYPQRRQLALQALAKFLSEG